jgi:hypothetical protein
LKPVRCGSVLVYNAANWQLAAKEARRPMFMKIVTLIVGLAIALFVIRQIMEHAERAKARVKAETKGKSSSRITTLEQDPETGVYRPKD